MAELVMLAYIQRMDYPEEVTINCTSWRRPGKLDRRSNHCATPPITSVCLYVCLVGTPGGYCQHTYSYIHLVMHAVLLPCHQQPQVYVNELLSIINLCFCCVSMCYHPEWVLEL